MAARNSSTLSPRHREAIKTSMLLNRLQSFALEQSDPQTGRPVEMSRDRMTAAITLLKKTLPDLTATQHSGDASSPIETSLTVRFKSPGG